MVEIPAPKKHHDGPAVAVDLGWCVVNDAPRIAMAFGGQEFHDFVLPNRLRQMFEYAESLAPIRGGAVLALDKLGHREVDWCGHPQGCVQGTVHALE